MAENILNIIKLTDTQDSTKKPESVFDLKNEAAQKSVKKKPSPTKEKAPFKNKKTNLKKIKNAIAVTVSEAAKIGGIKPKTIRRAIQSEKVSYEVNGNRYHIDLISLLNFLFSNKKLKNKLDENGIGQFIEKWRL